MQETPTKEQIKVLMSDWLQGMDRDKRHVHRNTRGTIKKTVENHYSENLIGDISDLSKMEQLKLSRTMAENIIAMMTDDKIHVRVGNTGNQSFTSGHEIYLSTDFFDIPDSVCPPGRKADILAGLAVHEAAHQCYTDFEKLDAAEKHNDGLDELRHIINNILEDERIEWHVGEERPGLADFLAVTKDHYFNSSEFNRDLRDETLTESKNRVEKLVDALLLSVRFPSALDEKTVSQYWKELYELKSVLTPYPKSTQALISTSEKVIDVLKKLVKEDMEQQQQSGSGNGQGDEKQSSDQKQAGTNGQGGQKAPTESQVKEEIKRQLASGTVKKAIEDAQSLSSVNTNKKQDSGAVMNNNDADYVNGDNERASGASGGEIKYVKKACPSVESYAARERYVRKYVPAMRKVLACKATDRDYALRGMPYGKLNTNKLVSFKSGNSNIFDKQSSVTVESISLCLVIDESGSMSGEKKRSAELTAVLIEQAVKDIAKIRFYAYGFSGESPLFVYSEPGFKNKKTLGSLRAAGGTPAGDAMMIAAHRIRRQFKGKCLMLVITDGMPNSVSKMRKADEDLRKNGFITIGIGIDDASRRIGDIMKETVMMTDISKLPTQLGKYTKKYLLKLMEKEEDIC